MVRGSFYKNFYKNFIDKKLCCNNIDIDINIDDIVLGDGKFFTMLDAYWWALITMTTVSHPTFHFLLSHFTIVQKDVNALYDTRSPYL